MGINEIRRKYFENLKKQGHAIIPSSSLVPENDPTTLFTGSGMQPLLPYLLGEIHPKGQRLADSQKCFRAEDIDEVGDDRHTTFFEMLGNWSLGDYFKEEQLKWFFKFLTDDLGLDPNRMYVTVFVGDKKNNIPRDVESVEIWKELFLKKGIEADDVELFTEEEGGKRGMQDGRIFYYDAKKNWWSRSGVPDAMPEGEPGGPDSEVFYEFPQVEHDTAFGKYCHPNCDCGRFVEIGNSVFMEFIKRKSGFEKLPRKNVDFGGGLERIAAAAQDAEDIFTIDVFSEVISVMEQYAGQKYEDNKRAYQIVADHIRGAIMMVTEGVVPSNTEQGYIVRRLLRRAIRYADTLEVAEGSLKNVVDPIAEYYAQEYPSIQDRQNDVEKIIEEEEIKFRKTLKKGLKEFERIVEHAETVTGKDAFVLFSTYGFPMEMTEELAEEKNISIDKEQYAREFQKHRDLSRTASAGKFKGGLADHSEKTTALHTATHLMLAGLRKYLGDHVHQAGSNITTERLRFDFTHSGKVEREILDQVERYVNEAIERGCIVSIEEVRKEDAKENGVEGSFWEKYPDVVNVYQIKSRDGMIYSQELCGGPHVRNTQEIKGIFKIKKEESSSAGVRRIKATLEE